MLYTLAVRMEKMDSWTLLEVSYMTNKAEKQERKEFEDMLKETRRGLTNKKMTWSKPSNSNKDEE